MFDVRLSPSIELSHQFVHTLGEGKIYCQATRFRFRPLLVRKH